VATIRQLNVFSNVLVWDSVRDSGSSVIWFRSVGGSGVAMGTAKSMARKFMRPRWPTSNQNERSAGQSQQTSITGILSGVPDLV
jgi:hypothetical protein